MTLLRTKILGIGILALLLVACGADRTVEQTIADDPVTPPVVETKAKPVVAEVVKEVIPEEETAPVVEEKVPEVEEKPSKEETPKQKVKKKKRAKVKGKPVLSFYGTTHNYGTIDQGDKIEHKFRFKNIGKGDLMISNVSASCGCTRPSFPFLPIEPGNEGEIAVLFDSKGKLGRQKPSITVVTNADPTTYKLYLEGFVDSGEKEEKDPIEATSKDSSAVDGH